MKNENTPQRTKTMKKKRGMGCGTPPRDIPELETPKDRCMLRSYEPHCLLLLLVALETGYQNPGMLEPTRMDSQSLRRLMFGS